MENCFRKSEEAEDDFLMGPYSYISYIYTKIYNAVIHLLHDFRKKKKKSLEPPGTSSGGFGNSNLKACAMAVLDFVINLFSSQCDFHEDIFFGQN